MAKKPRTSRPVSPRVKPRKGGVRRAAGAQGGSSRIRWADRPSETARAAPVPTRKAGASLPKKSAGTKGRQAPVKPITPVKSPASGLRRGSSPRPVPAKRVPADPRKRSGPSPKRVPSKPAPAPITAVERAAQRRRSGVLGAASIVRKALGLDDIDSTDLPRKYNKAQLAFMARDPNWAFAYWELPPKIVAAILRKKKLTAKDAALVLRVHQIATRGAPISRSDRLFFEVPVPEDAKSSYVALPTDDASYKAEIGLRLPDGGFVPISASNVIAVPPTGASDTAEVSWMGPDARPAAPPAGDAFAGIAGADVTDAAAGGRSRRGAFRDVKVPARGPGAAGAMRHGLRAGAATADRFTPHVTTTPARARPRTGGGPPVTDDDVRAYYRRLVADPAAVVGASMAPLPSLQELLARSGSVLFPEHLIPGTGAPIGSSALTLGGASETLAGEQPREGAARQLPLEITTELILRGRSEPGATISVNGQQVPTADDGAFELHLALDPGRLDITVSAGSADGALSRQLTSAVLRTPAA